MNYMNLYENLRKRQDIIDCSLSYNTDEELMSILQEIPTEHIFEIVNRYPDMIYSDFIRILQNKYIKKSFVLGSGSEDIIWKINTFLLKDKEVGVVVPNFYRIYETIKTPQYINVPINSNGAILNVDNIEYAIRKYNYAAIWISNPNPITGQCFLKSHLKKLILDFPNTLFIVDEVSIDSVVNDNQYSLLSEEINCENLIIVRSFSKFYAIPGARLGYACMSEKYAVTITKNCSVYPVSAISLLYANRIISNEVLVNRMKDSIQRNKHMLQKLTKESNSLSYIDSLSNIMIFQSERKEIDFWKKLLEVGIITCSVKNEKGMKLNNAVRITVPSSKEKFDIIHHKILQSIEMYNL